MCILPWKIHTPFQKLKACESKQIPFLPTHMLAPEKKIHALLGIKVATPRNDKCPTGEFPQELLP